MVREKDVIGVEDLAARFGLSTQTIRRDLNLLCEHGIARRIHGGVQSLRIPLNTAYEWRKVLHKREKQAIARAVVPHIRNGMSLAFSIGTTPEIVSRALVNHENLRIFTNNLNIAMAACTNQDFEVTVAGGRLRNEDRDVLGAGMAALFNAYKVDVGIFGVAGVDEDGGLFDFYEEEVWSRQVISENSRKVFLVLDHTKFGRAAHVRGGHITDADIVFCDRQPPGPVRAMIRDAGKQLVICGGENDHGKS